MRLTYLMVTFAIAAGGWWVLSGRTAMDAYLVGFGLATAWTLQAVAFVVLTRALERGGSVVRPWVVGMTVRGGGLVGLWLIAAGTGIDGFDLVVTYALALLVFLLLEAGWLAVGTGSRLQSKRKSTE